MTPKEKAEELANKMLNGFQFTIDKYTAKQCALIAVDEIQKQLIKSKEDFKGTTQIVSCFATAEAFDENLIHTRKENDAYITIQIMYWDIVKQRIQEL